MSDYVALVVDWLEEDPETKKSQWYSWIIRTYDPDEIKGMLAKLVGEECQLFTRNIHDFQHPAMRCSSCDRWDAQQNFTIDDNGVQAKCPQCGHWIYVEEADIGEI